MSNGETNTGKRLFRCVANRSIWGVPHILNTWDSTRWFNVYSVWTILFFLERQSARVFSLPGRYLALMYTLFCTHHCATSTARLQSVWECSPHPTPVCLYRLTILHGSELEEQILVMLTAKLIVPEHWYDVVSTEEAKDPMPYESPSVLPIPLEWNLKKCVGLE